MVPDRTDGMQMAIIGLDGVAPLRDQSSPPQKHTIWVAFEVSGKNNKRQFTKNVYKLTFFSDQFLHKWPVLPV